MPPKKIARGPSPPPSGGASNAGGRKLSRKDERARKCEKREEERQQLAAARRDGDQARRRNSRRAPRGLDADDLRLMGEAVLSDDALEEGELPPLHGADGDGGGGVGQGAQLEAALQVLADGEAGYGDGGGVGQGAQLEAALQVLANGEAGNGDGGGVGQGAQLEVALQVLADGVAGNGDGVGQVAVLPMDGLHNAVQGTDGGGGSKGGHVLPKKKKKNRPKGEESAPKQKGRKGNRRGCGDDWVPRVEEPLSDPTDPKIIALRKCELYRSTVEIITNNAIRQTNMEDVPFINLSSRPTRKQLLTYTSESNNMYLKYCPFSITVKLENGQTKEVPVTTAKPSNVKDYTHHIVLIIRESDGAEVHLLIEHFSNYLKAFKVVLLGERKEEKRWLILGLSNELHDQFKPFVNIKCDEGYEFLSQVTLHRKKFTEMFDLFISYDVQNPEDKDLTIPEQILMNTSFVCYCEILRFDVLKEWVLYGVTRSIKNAVKLPLGYGDLIRDWRVLCLLVFQLYTAQLEEQMLKLLPVSDQAASPFSASKEKVIEAWSDRQGVLEAIQFYVADTENVQLGWLCGRHITLLRHDYPWCNTLLMRYIGYDGPLLEDIQEYHDKKSNPSSLLPVSLDLHHTEAVNEAHGGDHDLSAFREYTFEELHLATAGFARENIISEHGEEGANLVYKGKLGQVWVAIKCFPTSAWPDRQKFLEEATFVGELQSSRLANLIGCCSEDDQRLLVAEYMENETLLRHLFRWDKKAMKWPMRRKVILYLAEALEYCISKGRTCYHNLSANRVMFDNDMNPRLSCFGLMKKTGDGILVKSEFVNPEAIYSFGLMLLDVLTGKNIPPCEALDLIRDWSFIVHADPYLLGQFSEEEGAELVQLAESCFRYEPSKIYLVKALSSAQEGVETPSDLSALSPIAEACSRKDFSPIYIMLERTGYLGDDETAKEMWTNQMQDTLTSKKNGDIAFKQKDFSSAIYFYSQVIAIGKIASPTIYSRRCMSYLMNEMGELALSDALLVLEMVPTWLSTCYLVAAALISLGRVEEARDILEYVSAE